MNTHTLRVVALTLAAAVILLLLVALGTLYTGGYNVAATEPHTEVTRWALNTLQQNSVGGRADKVGDPPPLDSAALRTAFADYGPMCAVCHGAPGEERGEFGKGMNPTPPRLERAASEWTDREVFWILKHGIRLAGMPAFGPTHSDRELWALTAVVRQLPELSAEEYQRLTAAATSGGKQGGHGADGHPH